MGSTYKRTERTTPAKAKKPPVPNHIKSPVAKPTTTSTRSALEENWFTSWHVGYAENVNLARYS